MSEIKGDRRCPSCTIEGRDSTGNHLIEFADGGLYCNKCSFTLSDKKIIICTGNYPPDLKGKPCPPEILDVSFDDGEIIKEGPPVEGLVFDSVDVSDSQSQSILKPLSSSGFYRKIPQRILEKCGFRVMVDEDDDPIEVHYPMTYKSGRPLCDKVRIVETKEFYTTKKIKKADIDLVGQSKFPANRKYKTLLLVEGEDDLAASYTMLSSTSLSKDTCVASVPTGANPTVLLKRLDLLNEFSKVVTFFDDDKEGQKLTGDLWKVKPDILCVTVSEKDACAMLEEGKETEFITSFANPKPFKPRAVLSAGSSELQVATPYQMGLEYPWEGLTKLTYGLRGGQIIGIGAAPGAGKSTLIKAIQQKLIYDHKRPIGIFDMESSSEKSLRLLVGYIMKERIHIPDAVYDGARAAKIQEELDRRAFFYDQRYYNGTWKEIEDTIRFLHIQEGVDNFFIDPLSSLVAHLSATEANTWLSDAMYRMSRLVQVLPTVNIFHVNHLNDTQGKHEEGGRVYAGQFTGSRAQQRFSTDIWGIERNQLSSDVLVKNLNILRILKARDVGQTGVYVNLKYDEATGTLIEVGDFEPDTSGGGEELIF